MKRMTFLFLAFAMLLSILAVPGQAQDKKDTPAPLIEVAILLDTSNSMDGLINQARTHLWGIVNQLALTERDGQVPELRVALYQYGNDRLTPAEGHIEQVLDLNTDLDKLSEKLFALTTNGGQEYCGQVIERAVGGLTWTEGDHFKAIFIAGNEPFTQGSVNYEDACRKSIESGIIVNTIHCGTEADGRAGMWHQGAILADGKFVNINQDAEEVALVAPQDKRLAELNTKLNGTYIGYGAQGAQRKELQREMDHANSAASPEAAAQRVISKGGSNYKNGGWDLVDACDDEEFELSEVEEKDLPENMQKMTVEEREAYVAEKQSERAKIQEEIQELSKARRDWVAEERKKMAEDGEETFDTAVKKALNEQLQKKGYKVNK